MRVGPLPRLVRPRRPPRLLGIAVAFLIVVVETLLIDPIESFTKQSSPSVIFILGVLVVSMVWGLWLGAATAVASALAFVYFYVGPVDEFAVSDVRDAVESLVFVAVALVTSALADLARLRSARAEESDLTAEMAKLLLNADDVTAVLPAVAQRIADTLHLPAAAIEPAAIPTAVEPGTSEPDATIPDSTRQATFPLHKGDTQLGTLRVPASVSDHDVQRLQQRVVPPLASLLSAAREREAIRHSLAARGEQLQLLGNQQAALRRVATLVARGVRPAEVFEAVTAEVSQLLGNRHTTLLHYEPDDNVRIVSTNLPGQSDLLDKRYPARDGTIAELVWRTGQAARIDTYPDPPNHADCRCKVRIHAAVAVPILVENRLWGTAAVTTARPEPIPSDAETRIKDFTDLAANAIANADSRSQLLASRARIVTAADEARQRIERDLHDGAQQQLVAVDLELRAATDSDLPSERMRAQVAQAAASLDQALTDLRELARGIHPAVLATGGLTPALNALAHRCPIPVDLHIRADRRYTAETEVAAYYAISESLTNAARHAHASTVDVDLTEHHDTLHLAIRDDGIGGANPTRGTGLTGLKDRVEALGGHMTITSPLNAGTTLLITIPTGHASPPPPSRPTSSTPSR